MFDGCLILRPVPFLVQLSHLSRLGTGWIFWYIDAGFVFPPGLLHFAPHIITKVCSWVWGEFRKSLPASAIFIFLKSAVRYEKHMFCKYNLLCLICPADGAVPRIQIVGSSDGAGGAQSPDTPCCSAALHGFRSRITNTWRHLSLYTYTALLRLI